MTKARRRDFELQSSELWGNKNDLSAHSLVKPNLSHFFPRASERRVLPIVGVLIYLYLIFSSSHLLIFMLEQPFRTKWGSIVKNWGKIANFLVPEQPFRTKWRSMRKNWGKIANLLVPDLSRSNPFARNEGRSSKTAVKLRFYLCWSNPFARNEGRSSKTEEKLRIYLCRTCPGATLSHEMRVDTSKIAILLVLEQPFRTKRCCV